MTEPVEVIAFFKPFIKMLKAGSQLSEFSHEA